MSTAHVTVTTDSRPERPSAPLSVRRVNTLRLGYALVGVGIAVTKWPALGHDARTLPVFEGVVLSMLSALSLLALLGLRHPVRMLPVLLFEVAWKVTWVGAVAAPQLAAGELGGRAGDVLVSCSVIVLVIAVIPWRYVWAHYVRAAGEPWR